MKDKLQLIYDEYEKREPPHGNTYHRWLLGRNLLRDLLLKEGGMDKQMRYKKEMRELTGGLYKG